MHELMLAQAQRCFYEKALRDRMSPKLLAKVAKGAADLYEQALHRLRAPELRGLAERKGGIDSERGWPEVVEWNHKLYLGLAHFHASFVHADAYEYGQQVASPNPHPNPTPSLTTLALAPTLTLALTLTLPLALAPTLPLALPPGGASRVRGGVPEGRRKA